MDYRKLVMKAALFCLFAVPLPAMAEVSIPADTVRMAEKADEVLVTRSGGKTSVEIRSQESWGENLYRYDVDVVPETPGIEENLSCGLPVGLPFLDNEGCDCGGPVTWQKTRFRMLTNIYWGWVFNYRDKMGLKNSFELGIGSVGEVRWRPWRRGPQFSAGIGFGMRRYNLQDGLRFVKSDDRLEILPSGSDKVDRSRLTVWNFQIPLMVSQSIGAHGGLQLGCILNLNTYGRASTRWKERKMTHSETCKGINQRLLTADLLAIIGFPGNIGAYARWSPMTMFADGYGPESRAWSIGVSVGF